MLRRIDLDSVELRLQRLERRIDDTDDALAASLAPDRVDELVQRVDELALDAATHEELVDVRLHVARLAAELTRVRAELAAEIDAVAAALEVLDRARSATRYAEPRRAAS